MRAPALRALLAVTLSFAAAAPAQVTMTHTDEDGVPVCSARAWASGGSDLGLGVGFVRVDLENIDARAHGFEVTVASRDWPGDQVRARRALTLQGGEQQRFFLPLSVPPTHLSLLLRVDGTLREASLDCGHGDGLVAMLLADRPEVAPMSLDALQVLAKRRGWSSSTPAQVVSAARDVPTDWRMFTAFAAIVVDGSSDLDADHQLALVRYAAAGGTVLVACADRLAAGILRDLAVRDVGAHGMGQIAGVPAFGGDTTAMRDRVASLPMEGALPVGVPLLGNQGIAGLGKAPVSAFVLVILLFAILVGPVNFIMLRRRKKPMLALLTVPALGFGTTLLILVYGVFHDGFGVRGVVTSVTLLDQPRRECTVYAARTLFAGLGPDELTMGEQTLLLSPRASYGGGGLRSVSGDRWSWDADRERLDGAVLPSRTPTPLLTLQQGTARQRLTLRIGGRDQLEVLSGGGVEPRGEMVLRDLDGRWWHGTGSALTPLTDASGRAALDNLLRRVALIEADDQVVFRRGRGAMAGGGERLPRPGDLGAPGTYVTEVASAPWLDEHGLSVDYDAQRHFVFGRLHAEDFGR